MVFSSSLQAHLDSGCTTLARAWAVSLRDGRVLGFTDHDRALTFEGVRFQPDSGMMAKALAQGTGLSVDNSEAYGALSSEAISEADLLAGRYDGADIRSWLVNWADVTERAMIFRGTFGEVRRAAGAFSAELRGLSEPLGQVTGRIYHPRCSAVLGDAQCRFDLSGPDGSVVLVVDQVADSRLFRFSGLASHDPGWFEKGRLRVLDGPAVGLIGVVKNDRSLAGARSIELWQRLGAEIRPGDRVSLEAGCDRRAETCRLKFNNFMNFRGFPHIPGEDWMVSYPVSDGQHDGGSLFR